MKPAKQLNTSYMFAFAGTALLLVLIIIWRLVDYARERLGLAKFNLLLYHLIEDAKPAVRSRPLVLRMIRRIIWESEGRLRTRRRFR